MLREDGTLITPENLSDEDIKSRRWNILERLKNEEKIKKFLAAALEEAPDDALFLSRCFIKAAQARAINQLVAETGINRQLLCDLFLDRSDVDEPYEITPDVIESLAEAFAVPLPT